MKRKYSGSTRARSVKRRRTTRAKSLRGRVNKILRFIKNNKPELKKATFRVTNGSLSGGLCVTYNLMYHMLSQGEGESQFVGKSINLKGIGIKGLITNDARTNSVQGYNAYDFKVLMSIIGHKNYNTTSSISITDINATEYNTFSCYYPHYDADKVKIHKQFAIHHRGISGGGVGTYESPDQLGGHPRGYSFSKYLKLNRKLTFERWNTDFKLKGNNLYFLLQSDHIGPAFDSGLNPRMGQYSFDITLYYTDD